MGADAVKLQEDVVVLERLKVELIRVVDEFSIDNRKTRTDEVKDGKPISEK